MTAWRRVVSNNRAAGIDNMRVDDLKLRLVTYWAARQGRLAGGGGSKVPSYPALPSMNKLMPGFRITSEAAIKLIWPEISPVMSSENLRLRYSIHVISFI